MKRKLIMSAALLLSVSSLSGCFFFPAEEELLDPPTVSSGRSEKSTMREIPTNIS